MHGDNIVQVDSSGARVGARATYDPFGQPTDPVTGCIGTNAADDAVANTSPGEADEAWAGGASKLYEHGGDIATIEMGARQYVPGLGRFIETDPITGGNADDYNYPNDPSDLAGLFGKNMDDREEQDQGGEDPFEGKQEIWGAGGAGGGTMGSEGTPVDMAGDAGAQISSEIDSADEQRQTASRGSTIRAKIANALYNSRMFGVNSKLFGNYRMGTPNVPTRPGGRFNRKDAFTKVGWSWLNGPVFRVSSTYINRNVNADGYGHMDIFRSNIE